MANDLDRLFREGLDQFEMAPAPASWDQVQGQIAGKRNKMIIWRVAAAIIILISATLVIINWGNDEINTQYISAVDHPSDTEKFRFEWKIPEDMPTKGNTQVEKVQPQSKVPAPDKQEILTKQFETLTLASINETKIDFELNGNIQLIDLKGKEITTEKIRITYIASNTPDTTKTNNFGQIWEYLSKDLQPATLLADIRDAKNQLLSRN